MEDIRAIIEVVLAALIGAGGVVLRLRPKFRELLARIGEVQRQTSPAATLQNVQEAVEKVLGRVVDLEQVVTAWRRAALETEGIAMFETDAVGNCLWTSVAYRRLTGIDSTDALGNGWLSVIHPDDRERVRAEWNAAVKDQRPFRMVYRVRNVTSGEVHRVRGKSTAARFSDRVLGYFGRLFVIAVEDVENDDGEDIAIPPVAPSTGADA